MSKATRKRRRRAAKAMAKAADMPVHRVWAIEQGKVKLQNPEPPEKAEPWTVFMSRFAGTGHRV